MNLGTQDRWFNSEPSPIQGDIDSFNFGSQNYWFNSEPSPIQIQNVVVGWANIKTINNLVYASIKTINNLAIASMKTFNGVS